jgi:uncharacterized protein (TIGR00255 family)
MKSMTGYGRGENTQDGYKITTEISSVNRRQSELNIYLPRELEPLESKVRNELNRRIARGRVTVRVGFHASETALVSHARINSSLAHAYATQLQKLARDLKISDTLSLDVLVRAPGIFEANSALENADHFWPPLEKSVNQAIDALVRMREREGAHLNKDLKSRIAAMKRSVSKIQKEAPAMVKRYTEQLRERIKSAGLPLPAEEDERLLKEIIYFADRSDISEELTRLQSHFKQFDECSKSGEPVGRTLDFLAQEMNREANTIGSKANDSTITREVVLLKTELVKFREQVQNVE